MRVVLLLNTLQVFNSLLTLLVQPQLAWVLASIAGSNIDTTDGSTANTVSAGTITSGVYSPGTIAATQDTAGAAFSFSQSYTQADAVPTSAATVEDIPNFGSVTSYTVRNCWFSTGTVTSAGVLTVTLAEAGTSAVGQFVSEVTVID